MAVDDRAAGSAYYSVKRRKDMQIRTAINIGIGVAAGVIIGMGVSEDTKSEIISRFKKRLIDALGGEVKKYDKPKPTTYNSYYNSQHKKKTDETDKHYRSIESLGADNVLIFETYDDAVKCFREICASVSLHKTISVYGVAILRDMNIDYDYGWHKYGWDESEIGVNPIVADRPYGDFKLCLTTPHELR